MSFNPQTDFMALLRTTSGGVRTARMPGLDYAIEALMRAGLITLFVGQSPPTANQASTVWFQPAIPSGTAEGVVNLFNQATGQFQAATPTLWSNLLTGVFPATAVPLVDATPGEVGTSLLYARQDHVHPTDTSRAPLNSPNFTGEPTAPTPALGDQTTNIATTAFVIANGGLPPPVGSVLPFAGTTVPNANWQFATGQLVSRTTFAALFAALGITFGGGDGVTTFALPDLRGRAIAGVDSMGGTDANRLTTATMTSQALGGTDLLGQTRTLVTADLPPYTPSGSVTVLVAGSVGGEAVVSGAVTSGVASGANFNMFQSSQFGALSGTFTGGAQGGTSTPISAVQPTMELNYIIRVS